MISSLRQSVSTRIVSIALTLFLFFSLISLFLSKKEAFTTFTETIHLEHFSPSPNKPFETPGARPLITYVYAESEHARENFKFFTKHALHNAADFIFIFNGPTTVNDTDVVSLLPDAPNIRHVRRNNDCFDLGAHAEVLTKDDLWKKYKRFIIMNASIRGPFMPHWTNGCWSERFLSKITDTVKLVGLSLNCWPTVHVQSMFWATDNVGLSLLLSPPFPTPNHDAWASELPSPPPTTETTPIDDRPIKEGINSCFHNYEDAVVAEVGGAPIIMASGYKIDVMLAKFQADPDYVQHCEGQPFTDAMLDHAYDGANVHPYETIFMKTNRFIDPVLLDNLSRWTGEMGYSSYDYCKA